MPRRARSPRSRSPRAWRKRARPPEFTAGTILPNAESADLGRQLRREKGDPMRPSSRVCFALLGLLVTFTAFAQRNTRPSNQLLVVSAETDSVQNRVYITGMNFGASSAPAVDLNNIHLTLITWTDTSIVAQLP